MCRVLLLNGPNLNLLGQRDQSVYGNRTLNDVELELIEFFKRHDIEVSTFQSNHEGELIDQLHHANEKFAGVIFNPGAYTHTSIALRDAVEAINPPVIEVHISNIHNREAFRSHSYITPVAAGQITGFGTEGYLIAAFAMLKLLNNI
ncbi:type II 3-dehydroquinate dehydratase [Piscibacillus halophilus]|uniref:3-dehydroquinate dehydratase n=1 Tax=Piscibacillus halophilus TaxID=571933 RepID=A0A1H9AAC4_9BACI|nr:type II 3-dehydroquinate dehydratase [Piscibacillus halophilus]SEP73634.1 3-dehydroquinate dehydratase [Piscibacillus halophilus]